LAYSHAGAMLRFSDHGARTTTPEQLGFWSRMKVLLAGVNVPRPASRGRPSDLAPDCRVLSIGAPGGVTLASWYCSRGEGTPLVILFHGYSAEKASLLREARAFRDLGASVMLVDFRGSGGSSESYTTVGVHEAEDVAAAMGHARRRLPHRSVLLFGRSMGAAAILRAVHEHRIQPDGVILEAVFDTLLHAVRNRFRAMRVPSFPSAELLVFWGGRQWGFDGFRHNPADYASVVECPVLLLHGAGDVRASLAGARRVFDALPGAKELVIFPQGGHESYLPEDADRWRAAVERFIERT
jgi:pimeloyl-ACP methyl ester carboxylesterase